MKLKHKRTTITFSTWDVDVLVKKMDEFVPTFILTKRMAISNSTIVGRLADDLLEGQGV